MKKTFFISFFLLIVCGFITNVKAQGVITLNNYTDCDYDITIDCYDLCIHYGSASITIPKNTQGFTLPVNTCYAWPGANDIVATIVDKCGNVVQVDIFASGPCSVGPPPVTLPSCDPCANGAIITTSHNGFIYKLVGDY